VEAGVEHVYRDTLDTALRLGTDAMGRLVFRAHYSHRAARKFLRHDEESLRELTTKRREAGYLGAMRRRIEELERMFQADLGEPDLSRDAGWDAESLRADYGRS
jgi:hypothetical protein